MEDPRIRVAAYVLRYRDGPELLVFDHIGVPRAGTQIPAGGVRPGEDLEDALRREIAEETGLFEVEVVGQLGVDHRPHPHSNRARRTTYFQLRTSADTADTWTHRVVGAGEDEGLDFACYFVPLPLDRPLADHQDAWLNQISS
ncbi:NUDIX domain-containing protein [Nocardia sp. NPDC019395]|uniref:NUDIX hydrolase n=1 Tax=Nocardia sp. NPDC019395 TaxID=3154686 RepID=UPI0033D4A335